MEGGYIFLIVIGAIINIIAVIVFFKMAANIADIKNYLKNTFVSPLSYEYEGLPKLSSDIKLLIACGKIDMANEILKVVKYNFENGALNGWGEYKKDALSYIDKTLEELK